MPPRHPNRLPMLALAALLLLAWLSGPMDSAVSADLEQEPTPPPPWEPAGSWQLRHGPGFDALWQGGEGRSERPCGYEADRATTRGTTAPLCAVHGRRIESGDWVAWAVGEQGMLARYENGSWSAVDDLTPRRTSPLNYHLHDVYVVAADDVWAVGWVEGDRTCPSADCGVVLHYDGSAWLPQPRTPMGIFACMERLNAIDMQYHPEQGWQGWAVGDATDDCQPGGALYLGYNYDPAKPDTWRWFRVPQAARNIHDVKMHTRDDVWAVGEFGIESHWYKPLGNPSWSVYGKSGADDRFAVDVVDTTYGWDAGVRGRLNRYLGSCHDDDQTTQCWFDNMASPIQDQDGNKVIRSVYALDFLDRRKGWLVGAEDGRRATIAHFYEGKRWRLVDIEGDPGKSLYGLIAVDEGQAFAVGDEGVILEYVEAEVTPPTATATPTATPSATPTIEATPPVTSTATATASGSPTAEPTPSPPGGTAATPTPSPPDAPVLVTGLVREAAGDRATVAGATVAVQVCTGGRIQTVFSDAAGSYRFTLTGQELAGCDALHYRVEAAGYLEARASEPVVPGSRTIWKDFDLQREGDPTRLFVPFALKSR